MRKNGGCDVICSAGRATASDRLAVGEITAVNSPDGADEAGWFESGSLTEVLVRTQVQVLPGTPIEGAKGGPTGMGRSDGVERHVDDRDAGHMPTCALNPRDVVTVGAYSPWSTRSAGSLRSVYP